VFKILKGLTKAAVGTVLLPLDMAKDAVTAPDRAYTGKRGTTGKRLRQIGEAIDEAVGG
jgi:hypothetical protein